MQEKADIRSHKVMELDGQKRERLINAAMAEFTGGYKKASTDVIVREAGISKGLLFHYFGSKENLYQFLIDYSLTVLADEYLSLINLTQPDLLDRLWQMTLLKLDLSYKFPAIFDFIGAIYAESLSRPGDNLKVEMYTKLQGDILPRISEGIDTSAFKEGIEVGKIINIVMWTLTGYANHLIGAGNTVTDFREKYGTYLEEIKGYFDTFRKAFYK